MHTRRKLLRLLIVGQLALHPDSIAVRRVGNRPVNSALAPALEPEVSLPRPRSIPVEEDVQARDPPRGLPRLADALAFRLGEVPAHHALLVTELAAVDDLGDGLVKGLEVRLREPLVLDGLQLVARLAGLLAGDEELGEGLQRGVGGALDEGVVAGVDAGGDEGRGLGVGAADENEVGAFKSQVYAF